VKLTVSAQPGRRELVCCTVCERVEQKNLVGLSTNQLLNLTRLQTFREPNCRCRMASAWLSRAWFAVAVQAGPAREPITAKVTPHGEFALHLAHSNDRKTKGRFLHPEATFLLPEASRLPVSPLPSASGVLPSVRLWSARWSTSGEEPLPP
jgi:hypothetical protein